MNIVDTLDEAFKTSKSLKIIAKHSSTNIPLEKNQSNEIKQFNKELINHEYIDNITYYITPPYPIREVRYLDRFLFDVTPRNLNPTLILGFRQDKKYVKDGHGVEYEDTEYTPKIMRFGKIYYIEKIGEIEEKTSRTITDPELLKKYQPEKEISTKTNLYRKVTVNIFPSEKLARNYLDKKNEVVNIIESSQDKIQEYDYFIKLEDIVNLNRL